ncbi:RagB/SusD family nutrient uptake outer membrane protein [Pedobacter hiemivivus]|uniref:RagB/SusD family nutrient uptake outer membrane protein n=1 Tax=Pedobacter hiemivivus TaxID=2530454 RepID=A0A4U1G884_9SPHI|nr:RagB/SusD family nutrient uptake outer membrane protein [Pedobacter hiemivivus]TKC60087.1 RagB/SusD family nutrient uptake outer membrane protein [Pedobacter hiemivivus]
MKKIRFTILLFGGLLILLTATRCKKFLQNDPVSTITPGSFWKDKSDADAWMAGIYNSVQTTINTNWFDWGEVRSDNVRGAGTGNAQTKFLNNALSASDPDIAGATNWTNLYVTISLCNYGIKYYPQMMSQDIGGATATYTDYLGQCYGLRALMYFYGLRVWGKVPIITEPLETYGQPTQYARSPIADVKKRILDDIDLALKSIGTNKTNKYNIQKAAIYALQTDVYMWFQQYPEALVASQNCITESACTWVTNAQSWKNMFTDPATSTETIFNLYWDNIERGGGVGVCGRFASGSNTNNYMMAPKLFQELFDRIDPVTSAHTDGRFTTSFDMITYATPTLYSSLNGPFGKFTLFDPAAKRGDGQPGGAFVYQLNNECNVKIPIYRFADIMLLRAEALAHTGKYQEALDIVNRVRNRVGYMTAALLSDYTGDIVSGIERTILTERQYELMGEGKRWFDLCRIGQMYNFTNGYAYLTSVMNPILGSRTGATKYEGANLGRIMFPINSAAFNANPKLVGDQNAPYDE